VFKKANKCGENCPYNFAEVCGSDGKTYSNECVMRVESCQAGNPGVRKAYDGPCTGRLEKKDKK